MIRMVGREFQEEIDEEIDETRKALMDMPEPVRTRTAILKAYPDEIVKRIQQIDGVIVQFEERT